MPPRRKNRPAKIGTAGQRRQGGRHRHVRHKKSWAHFLEGIGEGASLAGARYASRDAEHAGAPPTAGAMEVFRFLVRKEEEIRTRIHNFRAPIRDPRLRTAVTALYFCAPIVGGWCLMSYTVPEPDAMRAKLTANLSAEDLARIQQERDRLQREFDRARGQSPTAR